MDLALKIVVPDGCSWSDGPTNDWGFFTCTCGQKTMIWRTGKQTCSCGKVWNVTWSIKEKKDEVGHSDFYHEEGDA